MLSLHIRLHSPPPPQPWSARGDLQFLSVMVVFGGVPRLVHGARISGSPLRPGATAA